MSPARDDWKPNPQLISVSQLLRYEGVVLSASWLRYLVDLAATLRNPETHQFGVDKTLLTIGGVWERWEHGDLTWPQRCKDLVRLTGGKEQKPNTLMRKCERHGLVRRDKKGVPTSATTRC